MTVVDQNARVSFSVGGLAGAAGNADGCPARPERVRERCYTPARAAA
jgi:hypothetical protein